MKFQAKLTVETPTDTTNRMTRSFRARRELVWRTMTDPALLRRWIWAPPGWTMTVCEGDVEVGGKFVWAWSDASGHAALKIHGENREVVAPRKLTHTETMEQAPYGVLGTMLNTIELTEDGDVTHMVMTMTFPNKEARDGALMSGMEHGMEAGYVTLDARLPEWA
jgi:uncharacterized protein YndB with AHSA1/START domain